MHKILTRQHARENAHFQRAHGGATVVETDVLDGDEPGDVVECPSCNGSGIHKDADPCYACSSSGRLHVPYVIPPRATPDGPDPSEPDPPTGFAGRQWLLERANDVVNGGRAEEYGGPEDSFATIAALWTAYARAAGAAADEITAKDVAVMLALVKVARLAINPDHVDSWVDLAGYSACGFGIGPTDA